MALPISSFASRQKKQQQIVLSPLKCLNNLDPSPVKASVPNLLRNPFNQPRSVKRKLNLGPPAPGEERQKSPVKRGRMMELDEDANLEPPKMRHVLTPVKKQKTKHLGCYQNDWTLRTTLKVDFPEKCNNWNGATSSTHRRLTLLAIEESPSKLNDNTISLEALKNISTVYQHPYLSWLQLFPRRCIDFDGGTKQTKYFSLIQHSEVTEMMFKDWCESFDDLANLLIDGKCPYFYLCSDNNTILFKSIPSSNPRRPIIQAFITPFRYLMANELSKQGIEFKFPESKTPSPNPQPVNNYKPEVDSCSSMPTPRLASSIDSGNVSDLDDEEDDGVENEITYLESIGWSQHELKSDFRKADTTKKGFTETNESNTQSRSTSTKPLACIQGTEDVKKFVEFLKSRRNFLMDNLCRFAHIPPTLLSPREFRLCTPQYPQVKLVNDGANERPKSFELQGAILPESYKELHRLLCLSDNLDHNCASAPHNSSLAFKDIQFS